MFTHSAPKTRLRVDHVEMQCYSNCKSKYRSQNWTQGWPKEACKLSQRHVLDSMFTHSAPKTRLRVDHVEMQCYSNLKSKYRSQNWTQSWPKEACKLSQRHVLDSMFTHSAPKTRLRVDHVEMQCYSNRKSKYRSQNWTQSWPKEACKLSQRHVLDSMFTHSAPKTRLRVDHVEMQCYSNLKSKYRSQNWTQSWPK